VELKEEVLKIYDVHGTATNQIQYHRDQSNGRQWISFFVKTVRAQEAPKVGTFSNDDQGMNDGVDDEETVTSSDLRHEMDERIRQMGEQMAQRQEDLMRQSQQQTQQMMEQFMRMNMANNNNQQQPQQPQNQDEYVRQQQAAAAYQQQMEAAAARPDNATS
jgi:hypothetical protein